MRRIRKTVELKVPPEEEGRRLDHFLSKACPEISRTHLKELIESGYVLVNGQETRKPSKRLRSGDAVFLTIAEPEPLDLKPENIPVEVLYEDEDILVVVKPCGLVVHPSPGRSSGTLVNALLYHVGRLSSAGGLERPGIVHRLDRGTAGLMVIAKNDAAHRNLALQFAERKTEKLYRAIVKGIPEQDHRIVDLPIGRHPVHRRRFSVVSKKPRPAKSEFWVLERFQRTGTSLLKVKIYTGRTHQIRVHLSSIGYPILGDRDYDRGVSLLPEDLRNLMGECYMLVAYRLGFYHPSTKEWVEFEIEDPEPFRSLLRRIRELEGSLG